MRWGLIPNDLHYAFPEAGYLLLGIFLIVPLLQYLYRFRRRTLRSRFEASALKRMLVPRSSVNEIAKGVGICLVWILAALALMQPQGNGRYPLEGTGAGKKQPKTKEDEAIVQRKAHEVIFLVDASASMGVKDTRTQATRLDYAKEIVDEVMSRLRGESAALYAFTSDTTKLSPPTMDYLFVRLALREMRLNEGEISGTNVIEALADMRDAFFKQPTPKLKTLVILTDGGDTQLEGLQGESRKNQLNAMLEILKNSETHQLRVFTVGLGTERGQTVPDVEYQGKPVISSLDEELLKKLAEEGRGQYYFANQWSALDLAADLIGRMGEKESALEEYKVKRSKGITRGKEDLVYDLFFQIPLGCALFLLAWTIFFPDTRAKK